MGRKNNKAAKDKKAAAKEGASSNADNNKALTAKEKGNAAFVKEDYVTAVVHFTEALTIEPANHVHYSNRSAAHLKMGELEKAVADATKCTELAADWPKGYVRLATALQVDGKFEEAARTYQKGLTHEPENKAMVQGLAQCLQKMKEDIQKKKEAEELIAEQKEHKPEDTVIGIDLGTTYSCVAVWKDGQVNIIANSEGERTTPSYVAFTGDERLIGAPAKQQAVSNATNTVYDAKRMIGRSFKDQALIDDVKRFPFKVTEGSNGEPVIEVEYQKETKSFSPQEVSSMILSRMKSTAETFLGHPITKSVITVPAYFNDQQRTATKDAGAIAGMEVKRIINEPTAAALAYGLDRADTAAEEGAEAEAEAKAANNVLIFDLGGGTFDVSVLTIDGGIFEVKATGGDTHLGGEDFDNNLVDHLSNELKRKTKMETKLNPRGQRRLRTAAENCKRVLSTASTSTVEVDSIQDGVDLTAVVTRAKFEQINAELFTRCMDTVKAVMTDAQMEAKDINDIVLVGGSTRIPKIQDMLQEFFGGKELSKAINPDEAVAYGAAVQGAILSGAYASATSQLLLVDVTPLSLGIETTGRVMSTLIKRNTPIPCSKTRTYTTEEDMQTAVDVLVYEGERACTDSNNMLGQFTISGIERAKRGEPQVEVTFAIDANGMLNVCAQDKVTNAKANITITNNHSRLSPEEIERMTADAEKYAKEDARLIEQIELHNEIERTVYNGLEYIREAGNTMLEAKILEFKEWLQDNKGAVTSLPTLQAKQRQLHNILGIKS